MKNKYAIRYVTNQQPLREVQADEIKYSGGDADAVVAFYAGSGTEAELIGIVSMQPGMMVERVVTPVETGDPASVGKTRKP